MRETSTKGVFHEYDPMQRGHRIFVEQRAVDYFHEVVLGVHSPPEHILPHNLAADAISACIADQYKYRIAADQKRLKHFRSKYGPDCTPSMLPKARPDATLSKG
jgi:hypothetical protein